MGSAGARGSAAPARGARGGGLVSAPLGGAPFEVIVPDWPAPPTVRAAFTLRMGGVSAAPFDSLNVGAHVGDAGAAVAENRRRVRTQLRLPAEPLWLEQVHGTQVADLDVLSGQAPAAPPTADAAIARRAGSVCVMQVADCMPVLFAARDGRAVAAAHAGWPRGCWRRRWRGSPSRRGASSPGWARRSVRHTSRWGAKCVPPSWRTMLPRRRRSAPTAAAAGNAILARSPGVGSSAPG